MKSCEAPLHPCVALVILNFSVTSGAVNHFDDIKSCTALGLIHINYSATFPGACLYSNMMKYILVFANAHI